MVRGPTSKMSINEGVRRPSQHRRKNAIAMTTTVPKILDPPIGLHANGMRHEVDSLGDLEVPADRYRGAQTERSLQPFNIGNDRMPKEVCHACGFVKGASAVANAAAGRLRDWKGQPIERVCDEVIRRKLDDGRGELR
jgi:fumarate hydratase class II